MNRICKSLILNVRAIGQISRSQVNYAHPALGSLLALNNRIPALNVDVRTFVNKRQPKFVDFKGPRDEFQPPKYSKRFQPPTIENDDQYADAEPVEAVGHEVSFKAEAVKNGFAEFDLPDELIKRLDELNYKQPFEIQAATLKHTLAGKDVVGKAFTGSGKTLAFAIPIITRVLKSEKKNNPNPKCLVLSPTRELCQQLYTAIQDLAPQLKCIAIFGGAGYESQISKLGRGVDIVIATPGRLRDLMQRKNFIPDDIELVCLDEADEMLNPNFLDQIQDVLEAARKDKQMLMFSATLNKNVAEIVNDYMKNPVVVDLTKGKTQKLPANIEHYMHKAPEHRHARIAGACIEHFKSERCIIFVNRKKLASEISYKLKRTGIRSGDLHSDLSQTRREIILRSFREGRLNVIVATDVASRGIDVPEVDLVIQLEAPPSGVDYYVHRSGRTGRAGRTGKSVLIHSGSADQISRELSRLVKFKPIDILKDLEPTSDFSDDRRQKFTNKSRFNENDDDDDDILDSREHKPMRFTPRSSSSTYNTYNTYKGPRSYSAPRRFTDRSRFDDDDTRSSNYRRFNKNSDYEDESDDEEGMGVRKSFQPRRDQEFSRGKTSYSGGFRANREFKSFEPRNKSGESRNLFEDN